MSSMLSSCKTLCAAALVALFCTACARPSTERHLPPGTGDLSVQLLGFRNNKGQVIVSLFRGPVGFPDDVAASLVTQTVPITGLRAHLVFAGLPYASYALGVLHDENGDGEMETNWLGSPREGFGFSGQPAYNFGRPNYDDVAFLLVAPQREITIKLRYTTGRQDHQQRNRAQELNRPVD